jgi:ABC-type nitrate/sulfonate/bicarbonate transport system substrate-binding protein
MLTKLIAAALCALTLAARPAGAVEKVAVALDWTPNTNHVGLYVAKAMGYFDDVGLDVEILPYADTSSGALVASGVAEFGVFSAVGFFAQKAAGADLLATYAVVQHETGRIVFDAARTDIARPADLDGKTYAGFGSDWEKTLIGTIIRNDGGKGEFRTVTLGTSAYEALASGSVDFTLEVVTWEGVAAKRLGRAQKAFLYADYGVPDEHTTLIGGQGAWLEAHGDIAAAFMQAVRKGYAYAADHPDEAARLLVAGANGMLPDAGLVRDSMHALVDGSYLRGEDGAVGTIDPAKFTTMGTFLFESGVLRDGDGNGLAGKPDFQTWFTNRYLEGE